MGKQGLPADIRAYFASIGRKGGAKGGAARAANMTEAQRSEAARKAVQARWAKEGKFAMTEIAGKAIPVSDAELERIQRDFRFYSPVPRSCNVAPEPQKGEKWLVKRTLPSGLLVGNRHHENRWQNVFIKEPEAEEEDVRHLQYDIGRHYRDNPKLFIQIRSTSSLAWHPTKDLLVTAGDGILAKLWDAETGNLLTRKPIYSTSPGTSIVFSNDGTNFNVDHYLFDGVTGDPFSYVPGPGSDAYSVHSYARLRNMGDDDFGSIPVYGSSDFTPFRPNSSQYLLRDGEARNEGASNSWKPTPEQYGKWLVLRNRRTGEVEKAFDCLVPSKIQDFAWHPRGRFLAVGFEEDNVRIIDVDDIRTVDSLSVQHLVGWSPDGRTLVLRKTRRGNEFVIWSASETKEIPMPDSMKNEGWFRRFSKNMSADGLRYVRGTSIYSTDSDEVVATLPTRVVAAAWSPTDGGIIATCGGSAPGDRSEERVRFEMDAGSAGLTHIWQLS